MQTLIGMVLLAVYHPWLLAFDVLMIAAMLFIIFVPRARRHLHGHQGIEGEVRARGVARADRGAPGHVQVGRRRRVRRAAVAWPARALPGLPRQALHHPAAADRRVVRAAGARQRGAARHRRLARHRAPADARPARRQRADRLGDGQRVHEVRQAARGLLRPQRRHRQAGRPRRPAARAPWRRGGTQPDRSGAGSRSAMSKCTTSTTTTPRCTCDGGTSRPANASG